MSLICALIQGPNFTWHLDGYDSTSLFMAVLMGKCSILYSPVSTFPHGSFSRKLLWLCVAATNRDPRLILHYFLEAVESVKGPL